MTGNPNDNSATLPGLEFASQKAGPVHAAYATAIQELRRLELLEPQHEGIAANLLRLALIIDNERKGYAVAQASTAAAALMDTLLKLIPSDEIDDEWTRIMQAAQQPQHTKPPA